MRLAARLLIVALLVASTACGWRLRGHGGSASLEGVTLFVDATAVSAELQAPLNRGLRAAGATLSDEPQQADAILKLLGETTQQRAASISADARVQEYELIYNLRYQLQTAAGEPLVEEENIQLSEVYPYDSSNVLGSQSRAANVTERLRQDVTRMLLPRLQAVLRQAEQE